MRLTGFVACALVWSPSPLGRLLVLLVRAVVREVRKDKLADISRQNNTLGMETQRVDHNSPPSLVHAATGVVAAKSLGHPTSTDACVELRAV